MVIKNLSNQYYVVEKKKSTKDFDVLHCRLMSEDTNSDKTYDLIKIKNREKMPYLIQMFTEKESNQTFFDMYDCFSKNGVFYIAFEHCNNPSLREKLKSERCILRERLEIGKNVLERAILLAMPDFLQAQVMNPDNVLVGSDTSAAFSYVISSISDAENGNFDMVMSSVAELMEFLFAPEIEKEESEDIKKFIETCYEYRFKDMLEFYQEYSKFYDVVCKQAAGGFIKPNTLLFRIWNKIKIIFVKSKKWILRIIVIILVIFLLKTILEPEKKSGTKFDRIGTVEIESTEDTH